MRPSGSSDVGDQAGRPPIDAAHGGPATTTIRVALSLLAISLLASWLFLAVAHVDDRYNVGWVEGSRMALARSAASGVLYPPLYDGHRYGGTRFMPVPILLHAGVAQATDEYLISGKLLAYVSAGLLLGLTFLVLRRMDLRVPAAAVLTTGTLATRPGLLAATTVQGDSLSVLFQLGAVAVIGGSKGRRSELVAAGLCTLAIASKLSAVWAPMAILLWLLIRDRRRLLPFLGTLILMLLATFALLQLVTDGRLLANLAELTFAGVGSISDVLRSPLRLLELVVDGAPVLLVLAPFALAGEPLIAGRSGLSIFYVALLMAILSLLVILSDRGTQHNHLLDITVLTVIVVGRVWSLSARGEPSRAPLPSLVAIAVLWGIGASAVVMVRPDLQAAVGSVIHEQGSSTDDQAELAREVGPQDTLLAEDPFVPVSLDRTPVVLDAWALLRLARSHPQWVAELAGRIEARAFDKIVLVYPVTFEAWYRELHFGAVVSEAIRENYRLAGRLGGYYLYVPGEPDDEPAATGST
jgi:hypothetical protein